MEAIIITWVMGPVTTLSSLCLLLEPQLVRPFPNGHVLRWRLRDSPILGDKFESSLILLIQGIL